MTPTASESLNTTVTNASVDDSQDVPPVINEDHPQSLQTLMETALDGSDFTVGVVQEDNTSYTRSTITYTSDGRTVSGIMNVPKGEGPFPVLFLNHGFIDPSVYTNGRGLRREQDALARQGYVVVHADYRGHAFSDPFPEGESGQTLGTTNYTRDVLNAIVALRTADLPSVDADRVGLLGHSMGGGISQNILVTHPELIDAAVLYAPVSSQYQGSFDTWRRDDLTDEELAALADEIGPLDAAESFAAFSSRTYFDRVADPVLIVHGTDDESCPYDWSVETRDLLEDAGKDVELLTLDGEHHEFGPQWGTFMERAVAFFDAHLAN